MLSPDDWDDKRLECHDCIALSLHYACEDITDALNRSQLWNSVLFWDNLSLFALKDVFKAESLIETGPTV